MKSLKRTEKIVLGGGCFWCLEAVFKIVTGVVGVTPGYAGGSTPHPAYKDVCKGITGHAEVVLVEYDLHQLSLEHLLVVFFSVHDPTTPNRQGDDLGSQYRSIILYRSDDQRTRISEFIRKIRNNYPGIIVTEVEKLQKFYPAEDFHMNYYDNNPMKPYCQFAIQPKINKAKEMLGIA